jgi:hypothetical protein
MSEIGFGEAFFHDIDDDFIDLFKVGCLITEYFKFFLLHEE